MSDRYLIYVQGLKEVWPQIIYKKIDKSDKIEIREVKEEYKIDEKFYGMRIDQLTLIYPYKGKTNEKVANS